MKSLKPLDREPAVSRLQFERLVHRHYPNARRTPLAGDIAPIARRGAPTTEAIQPSALNAARPA